MVVEPPFPSSPLSAKHFLQDMNKSMGNAVEFNININVNVSVMQCAMCSFWLHVLHGWCQNEAAEKYMKPAAHGVCAIFVVQQQLLLRQQKPKLQMGFYCCCCCFSTSFFAIQFINMENGFGNWSVKCALLIRRTGRTSSHPNGETISDLGHFIMPFTCLHTHTCAPSAYYINYTLRIRHVGGFFFRKFMQAKSKIRWQINYAQNSWPLCWVRSVNWLQTRCRTKTKEQIAAGSNSSEYNINFSYSSSSELHVNSCNWQGNGSLITKSSPKNIFSHSSAGKSCARLIC